MLKYGESHGRSVNKSHAAAYAAISMQTAYLKAHYPTEFFAGLLTSVMDNTDKLALYLAECKKNGLEVLPPDINSSFSEFSVAEENSLYYGLSSIKGVGNALINSVIEERTENGPFKSLYDFIYRCNVNKGALESLINAGAFDFTGYNRPTLVANIEDCQKAIKKKAKTVHKDQISIFDIFDFDEIDFSEPEVKVFPDESLIQKALKEKAATGIFITLHPLEVINTPKGVTTLKQIQEEASTISKSDSMVTVCGIITEKRIFFTKTKGEKMAVLKIEDGDAELKVVIFPKSYAKFGEKFEENDIVSVSGFIRVDEAYEETSIHAENMENLNVEKTLLIKATKINSIAEANSKRHYFRKPFYDKNLFSADGDGFAVKIRFLDQATGTVKRFDLGSRVSDIYEAEKVAKKVFGEDNVQIHEKKLF